MDCSPTDPLYSGAWYRRFGKSCIRTSQPRPTYRQPVDVRDPKISNEGKSRKRRAGR